MDHKFFLADEEKAERLWWGFHVKKIGRVITEPAGARDYPFCQWECVRPGRWLPVQLLVVMGLQSFCACSLPSGCEFGQADMQKLVPKEEKAAPNAIQGTKKAGMAERQVYCIFRTCP